MLKSLREQINRDDGSFFQVGNRPVGTFEAIGLLSMVIGLTLWQFHEKAGVDIFWALGVWAAEHSEQIQTAPSSR